ncbi:hypothetical protein AKO1_008295 [Acrasis kona]|uniref:Uncharacterized protein n=1 Tax=Acrasis kona TaxID=1008807 RepID=A0AAW2YNE2_9EUKA
MTDTSNMSTSESFSEFQCSPIRKSLPNKTRRSQSYHNGFKDSNPNPVIRSQFDYLYFHATNGPNVDQMKCGVYSEYNRETDLTLLLICDPSIIVNLEQNAQTTQNWVDSEPDSNLIKRQLANVARFIDRNLNTYAGYLKVRSHIHITMLHYLHYCPGMIHFIYVDRVRNTIIAPRIVSLHVNNQNASVTIDVNEVDVNTDVSTAFIKSKVWEMCCFAQQYRDEGYTEVGMCGTGVQYWFKEWLEDENSVELRFCRNNLKFAKAHYELYTIYLPFVSTQAISHYNRILVSTLRSEV